MNNALFAISALVVGGILGALFIYVMAMLNARVTDKWRREFNDCK